MSGPISHLCQHDGLGDFMFHLFQCKGPFGEAGNRSISGLLHSQMQKWLLRQHPSSLFSRPKRSLQRSPRQGWYHHFHRRRENFEFNRAYAHLDGDKFISSEDPARAQVQSVSQRFQLKLQRRHRVLLFVRDGGCLFQGVRGGKRRRRLRDTVGRAQVLRIGLLEPVEGGDPGGRPALFRIKRGGQGVLRIDRSDPFQQPAQDNRPPKR